MAQITVEDILKVMDEGQIKLGRLQVQRDALQREVGDLSRRIVELTEGKEEKKNESSQ